MNELSGIFIRLTSSECERPSKKALMLVLADVSWFSFISALLTCDSPSQLMTHETGSPGCPSYCRSHSGGDNGSVASVTVLFSLPLPSPPEISDPATASSGTTGSWTSFTLNPNLTSSRFIIQCLHSQVVSTLNRLWIQSLVRVFFSLFSVLYKLYFSWCNTTINNMKPFFLFF